MSYAIVLHPTYLETWDFRWSGPATCDNLLAPNMAQTDLTSFLSYQDGVFVLEGDSMDDTEMYRQAFCVCEALTAPSIALRF